MRAPSAIVALLSLLVVAPGAARAQGVLVGGTGGLKCVEGGAETHVGMRCSAVTCAAPRVCLQIDGLGARCLDRATEIPCIPSSLGCDACPLISTGADPESCRVVDIEGAPHALCIYGNELACVADPGVDVAQCAPSGDSPSLATGDCDADGVPNGVDACACEAAIGSSDGCPFDGGVDRDAGPSDDAGTTEVDGAPPGLDAGAPIDAAAPRDGTSFRGGGGCACRLGAARSEGPVPSALLLVLGLVAAGRRRRR